MSSEEILLQATAYLGDVLLRRKYKIDEAEYARLVEALEKR